jgi:uncharacterized membrane protein
MTMRRIAGWCLLILGAFLVLAGVIDSAVGPELQEQETGVRNPRWYGLIHILIGIALGALGHRLTQAPQHDGVAPPSKDR